MLDIQTFDARQGGNVLYKALAHPLAAEAVAALAARLREAGPLAVYDPDGTADALFALHPRMPPAEQSYVHDVARLGARAAGVPAGALTNLPGSSCATLLVAAFNAARIVERIRPLLPPGMAVATLDEARIPEAMLTARTYLDRLNFATNFAFFRDSAGLSTRLVSANYWAGYGAASVRLWLRLFDGPGRVLATWEQAVPSHAGGLSIDSAEVRARFALPEFAGQLFIHAIGVAGHDVVKYAVDTYGSGAGGSGAGGSGADAAGADGSGADGAGDEASLSCTHDANAWPSDRYAGLPAPREDERVLLWVQNSHAAPIPAGTVALDRMGAERPVLLEREIAPFASVAIDVAELLPGLRWPAQIEVRSGRHFVRPRYEVIRAGRTRIAHMNVERADLRPDAGIAALSPLLGRGYILPFPILPAASFRTIVQPTPMAERQRSLPLRLDLFDAGGALLAAHFLGNLPRLFDIGLDLAGLCEGLDPAARARLDAEGGHADLAYDFRDGGEADGWMHALVRYEHRESGHAAESSFGSHIFNTAMTYRDEPQSYAGPPPGLSTRLFLRLGHGRRRAFTHLSYAASAPWRPRSSTALLLHDSEGQVIAEESLSIACCGSRLVFPDAVFGDALLRQAGAGGYVIIRDPTCRLFGYHGLMDDRGGFSLDHMFGF